jgi:hypothetical protein
LNNIFGISKRSKGHIEDDGKVIIDKIESYDIVGEPGFSNARIYFSDTIELLRRLQEELKRKELLDNRKEKIKKLNNL